MIRVFFKADFFPKAVGEEGTLLGEAGGSIMGHPVHPSGDSKNYEFMNLILHQLEFQSILLENYGKFPITEVGWGLFIIQTNMDFSATLYSSTVRSTAGIERGTLCWSTCLPIAIRVPQSCTIV